MLFSILSMGDMLPDSVYAQQDEYGTQAKAEENELKLSR